MNRRELLSSLGAGVAAATAGCVADGRVAMEMNREIAVEPLTGWWEELPDVGGNGALSLTVRADQQFDLYYFTDKGDFEHYRLYINNTARAAVAGDETEAQTAPETTADPGTTDSGTTDPGTSDPATTDPATTDPSTSAPSGGGQGQPMPTGHEDLSQAAVPNEESEKFEVQIPDDGGRKDIETAGAHYLVVDHSNYGTGVRVDRFQDPLRPFVDLTVIDEDSLV